MEFAKVLKAGDKVFIAQFLGSWGGPSYTRGVVQKITPSGMIDVLIGHGTAPTRFNPDGRQRGSTYCQLDNRPFAEREADLDQRGRIAKANEALQAIAPEKFRNPEKATLILEVARLQNLLDNAKKLIEVV